MRRLLPALLVTVFLAAAGSADAAPRWLDAELPFGDAPALTGDASAAMAPDGTAVYARFAPDGALEVRERPPGGPVGPTISLQKVTVAPPPQSQLEVLTGADGSAALTFNVGGIRFASVRAAGGRWTDPSEAAPAGGQAALAPDGVLWIVARSPALDDTLSVYRFGPDGRTETTPLPATNARQLVGALTVPTAGEAHVAFLEQAAAPGEGDRCVLRSKVRAVDVFANGTTGIAHTLDQVDAGGTGTAENCAADSGSGILGSLLLSTDAVGADTVVYTRLALEDFTVTPFARHRDPGGAWPAIIAPPELVSDADVLAETLIGGAGDPVVVVRQGAGKAIATRRADGTWTPVKPCSASKAQRRSQRRGRAPARSRSPGSRAPCRSTSSAASSKPPAHSAHPPRSPRRPRATRCSPWAVTPRATRSRLRASGRRCAPTGTTPPGRA